MGVLLGVLAQIPDTLYYTLLYILYTTYYILYTQYIYINTSH